MVIMDVDMQLVYILYIELRRVPVSIPAPIGLYSRIVAYFYTYMQNHIKFSCANLSG